MKVVSIQQLERDLDRIIDDVIDQQEHYSVNVSFITCAGTENDPCTSEEWEEKSIAILPKEDYEIMKDIYIEWLEDSGFSFDETNLPY